MNMVHVKICGITNIEDALIAADAGADLLGFVFYAQSPRYIEPERAREIIAALRMRSKAPKFVGVFVNESLDRVQAIMQTAQLDFAQLHGDEPPDMVHALSPFSFKALRLQDAKRSLALVETYRAVVKNNTPAFIVDAYDTKQFGGTGTRADWSLAASISNGLPILLAGGLNPENVADAIHAVRPWGVDVSSGVERAPGLKDHTKVRQFVRASRNVASI
jgi:phosphoribosylanthranilate isomerase